MRKGCLGSDFQNSPVFFYSFDDKEYVMMRNAWMQDNIPMKVGVMATCSDGQSFEVKFDHFKVKHLPDQRMVEWLEKNK